jgi:hypothetical protein
MRELPDLFEDVGRNREISAIRERLARLESEKAELEGSLNKLLAAQEARDSPPPVAELALHALGFVLRDIGWAA